MSGYRWGNMHNLREVKTLFDLDEINKAQEEGNIILFKERVPHPSMWINRYVFRNRKTGKYQSEQGRGYTQQYTCDYVLSYSYEDWEEVLFTRCYLRNVDFQYGAYVIPGDVKVNEKLYIENLIEDLYLGNFWDGHFFSEDGDARWNGKDLVHDERIIPFVG